MFVPLTRAWGHDGSASVLMAALEDAGFHPAMDCDPRGWMHFSGWPFGSPLPITLWIPASEAEEAAAFLSAECAPSWELEVDDASMAGLVRAYRPWLYAAWLFNAIAVVGLLIGVRSLGRLSRNDKVDG